MLLLFRHAFVYLCVNYCAMLYDMMSFVWLCLFVRVFLLYVCVSFVCDVLRVLYGCMCLFVCVFVCVLFFMCLCVFVCG